MFQAFVPFFVNGNDELVLLMRHILFVVVHTSVVIEDFVEDVIRVLDKLKSITFSIVDMESTAVFIIIPIHLIRVAKILNITLL